MTTEAQLTWVLGGVAALVVAWASQQNSTNNLTRLSRAAKENRGTVNYNSSGQPYVSLVQGSGLNNQSGNYSTGVNQG